MAGASEDDVEDGDTTAAGIAPATRSAAEEEDRTVQQPPDPKLRNAIANQLNRAPPRAPVAVPAPGVKGTPIALPTKVTSKRMTVVGLAPPAAGSAAAPPAIRPPTAPAAPPARPATNPAAAPPTSRAPTNISPLATTMDKQVGPTSTNPSSGPGSTRNPVIAAKVAAAPKGGPPPLSKVLGATPAISVNGDDEEDPTATATAPQVAPTVMASAGVKPPPLPLTVPGPIQITELRPPEEEGLDETEVRTVVSGPPPDKPRAVSAEKPAAAKPAVAAAKPAVAAAAKPAEPPPEDEDDELEDSVTTQAPSGITDPRLPEEDDEPKTSPPLRMPPPIPAAGRSPFDEPPIRSPAAVAQVQAAEDDEDAYNVEDSVTTRGPAVPDFRIPGHDTRHEDSVTGEAPSDPAHWPSALGSRPATMSQALGLPPKHADLPPALEDHTEGTTNRFAGRLPEGKDAKKGPPRPTTQASPVALNIPPKVGALEPLEEVDNRTAVMLGAPVKPPPSGSSRAGRPQIAAGMATHLSAGVARATAPVDKSSESGLRVAPHEQPKPMPPPSDERASLGAMMQGALHQQTHQGGSPLADSGVSQREYPSSPLPPLQPHQVPHHFPASEPNLALGATIPANSPLLQQQAQMAVPGAHGMPPMAHVPQMQQYDFAATIKKPRYGLLVGLVALLSFAIPLVLVLWLHQNVQEPSNRAPAEVASDRSPLAPPSGARLAPAPPASSAPPKKKR